MTMTVPTGQQALFLARLSAHTLCQYRGNCDVRFTVNGDLMQPDDGLIDAASGWYGADLFASGNDDAWQQHIHTMIKGAGPYPAGTYTIRAQAYLADPGDTEGGVMELRDWQFEVERARAG